VLHSAPGSTAFGRSPSLSFDNRWPTAQRRVLNLRFPAALEISCFNIGRETNLKVAVRNFPSYLWTYHSTLTAALCATDGKRGVHHGTQSPAFIEKRIPPLKWPAAGSIATGKAVFYGLKHYSLGRLCRSDLDGRDGSDLQDANGQGAGGTLQITNNVPGLRLNHSPV
jgi:hypothetical protein